MGELCDRQRTHILPQHEEDQAQYAIQKEQTERRQKREEKPQQQLAITNPQRLV